MSWRPPPDPIFTITSGRRKERITAVRFLRCNEEEKLVSGTGEGNIDVWDLKTFRAENSWNTPDKKGILWLGFHGDKIISQSRETICTWIPSNAEWIESGRIPNSAVSFCGCDVTSDGTLVAPTETDGKLQLVSVKDLKLMNELSVVTKHGMCMCVKIATPLILSGFEDGFLVVWDERNGKTPLIEENICCPDPVTCMDFDPDLKLGVSGSPGKSLSIWDFTSEGSFSAKEPVSLTNPGLSSLKIRSDHRIFVSGGWDCRIRVFHCKTLQQLAVLNHHSDNVVCLDFSERSVAEYGQLLAAGSNDSSISLWNIYSKVSKQKPYNVLNDV